MIQPVPATPADLPELEALFREYADSLGVDLEYQDFAAELLDLPRAYAPPDGALFVARDAAGAAVGCVAIRALDRDTAEMKRLYVRPAGRAHGTGRALAEAAIRFAGERGYRRMVLDTLPEMQRAQDLYRALGFHPIPPYRFSPVPGTVFLERFL